MKHVLLLLCTLFTTTFLFADSETVDGITWEYSISNDKAIIGPGDWGSPAISTSTSGDITIPKSLGGSPVTAIGECAFEGCSSLTSVTIPEGVTEIGWGAFLGCENLTSVKIPGSVTVLDDVTFEGCINLTSVTLSEGLKSIGSNAFGYSHEGMDCELLSEITIPASVEIIGSEAFVACTSLTSIKFEGRPPFVDSGNAFRGVFAVASYPPKYAEAWQPQIDAGRWAPLTFKLEDVLVFTDVFGDGTIKSENDVITHFPKGETKTLTAEPAAGYVFMGWSGDLISTEKSITLSGDVDKYNLNVQFLPETLLRDFVGSGSGSGSGGGSTSGGLSADDVKSIIADMIASGDLVNTTTLEEKAKEQAEAVVNEKVETKEIVTKQQIQDLSMKTPVIDVTSGSGTISFALQKSTNLSDENGWEEVDVANPSVDTDGNVTIAITPEEDEDTAFYKFVVPKNQAQ